MHYYRFHGIITLFTYHCLTTYCIFSISYLRNFKVFLRMVLYNKAIVKEKILMKDINN